MATQRYGRSKNAAILAKVEAVEGTAETLTSATDAMPCAPFTSFDLGEQTLESNEATGSIIKGETTVTRFDPRLPLELKMRGTASVATAPRQSPVLRAGGMTEQVLAVLPATGVFDVASAPSTSSIVIAQNAGTGTQLAGTNALLAAQLVGRVMTLSVAPATPRDVVITSATITTTNVTITFGETVAGMGATTEAVIKPGILYQAPTATPPSLTIGGYRDGKRITLVGCRPKLAFAMPGSERPTMTADFGGSFQSETDTAMPSDIDFTGLPSEPIWRNGRAWFDYLETGCSNFSLDFQTTDTKYINPNLQYGVDRNILTEQNPGGTLVFNDKLVAYHDLITKVAANTKMPFVAVTDMSGAAGSRLAVAVPNMKILKKGDGEREGILENNNNFQAVYVAPTPAFTFFYY
jgi:hypothetical protein